MRSAQSEACARVAERSDTTRVPRAPAATKLTRSLSSAIARSMRLPSPQPQPGHRQRRQVGDREGLDATWFERRNRWMEPAYRLWWHQLQIVVEHCEFIIRAGSLWWHGVPSSHYYLHSLSRTSGTSFPDSRDLLEVLGGLPRQRERDPREDPLGSGRIP